MLAADRVPWAFEYPRAWVVPLKVWINGLMQWLRDDASFGLFTFQELTRALAWLLEQPFVVARSLLSTGFVAGIGQDARPDLAAAALGRADRHPGADGALREGPRARARWWRSASSTSRCSGSGRAPW